MTPDVVRFVEDSGLHPTKEAPKILDPIKRKQFSEVIRNPARFFSCPDNVPLEQRQQVYLPNILITLIRTPHLPPRFASFWVPLWFNKIDMKDYLLRVYDVEVVHIRSSVHQQKVYREQILERGGKIPNRGRLIRPMSKKKMTVQLVEPFVWPEEVTDLEPWEKKTYLSASKEREARQEQQRLKSGPTDETIKSIAEQAKAVLRGKQEWKPTWKALPIDEVIPGRPDTTP